MLEYLAFPLAAFAVATLPSVPESDKKKIKKIFENVGYGIRKKDQFQTPKFAKKNPIMDGEERIGTKYSFSVPLGLPATKMKQFEKEMNIFSDGLKKPVIIEFNKFLNISVYDKEIPAMFPYGEVPEKKGWVIPLGRWLDGMVWHNFDHTPHMTTAGTTRFGKTVFLKTVMTYLIEHHPEDVEFYIIDLKGGLEFSRFERLEQVKGVASDSVEAAGLLGEIMEQVQRDYMIFRKKYWSNVVDTPYRKRRFIIVDEAAQLAPEKWMGKEEKKLLGFCQHALGEIARIAGALGYRLIYATQYPTADTLPRQIKQNSDAKITFRLPSGYASQVAIDDKGAEELPSDVKGRALFKTHEIKELQVPYISNKEMWERLERYQKPIRLEGEAENIVEETATHGTNLVEFR
ncbi:FtsK/SpoIIIE domain-containing protein [Heyndrickxia acidiproducens]|uniref:FtsK/SpoIIIE domain-containing protein n=1 Tax=Heyndrickxia acidiproducens TaxID=1121084 RepID=UPI0003703D24|nr:FtsK/SpoIIIE domain-containing protein [Heyndrickxia acidiproducens]